MPYTTFAAIDIGSYELSMKIFELSSKLGMREIDHIRHRIELGMDTYRSGRISHELVEELCEVLQDFKRIMGEYRVSVIRNPVFLYKAMAGRLSPETWRRKCRTFFWMRQGMRAVRKRKPHPRFLRTSGTKT